ncbi:2-C-methyl-D-erythritol 4-phosphate cytidylyltransferase [Psychrobacter sp. ANT_H59]|uniref:IspD/TarI family cytidylyltransferase n=1 Tax=Psychrobacter sp. ANT_H59 TaxID=2597354 RepID=UPI0011EEAB1D|nr:2-C-methyl-D-erythritol 4-phosphate cytidylyltransferase [Psychrobacter sp. ANT_H59]KAA0938382.1 2-C-methyl-D-erythritol 4-phosphate cytidylyltransferase [Psychrobacter sp. ANT_H59]
MESTHEYCIMNTTPNIHAMIVAAGRGSRFGASIAKQYTLLQGQTLLQHSVARLAESNYIDQCLLVVAQDDSTAQTLSFALPIYYAIGGTERWQSVQAGVEAMINAGADESDLVVIHDAARPAVPSHDIDAVIQAAMLEPYGAILATPVADTLKQSYIVPNTLLTPAHDTRLSHQQLNTQPEIANNQSGYDTPHTYAQKTIDRSHMWQAQTPQVFRLGQLQRVLNYVAEHNLAITDEASAFEYLELPIRLVTGSRQNIKLTYPDDIILLTAILKAQFAPSS